MNPSEKIVEQYINHVKNWLTLPNIIYGINNELDLLAYDPRMQRFYCIEVTMHFNFGPGRKDFSSVYQFKKGKFTNALRKHLKERFKIRNAKYVWVVWMIRPTGRDKVLNDSKKYGIEIWEFKDKIKELMNAIGTSNYQDEILRTLSLVKKSNYSKSKD